MRMEIQNQLFIQTRCFAATYANIEALLAFVAQASHLVGFDCTAADGIQLAVGEACSNIIKHGYGGEGSGEIICTCWSQATALAVILRDWAPPFDPTAQPMREPADPTRRLIPGGWGIFLMRHFVDELYYWRENETSNVLFLIKHKERNRWQSQPDKQAM